MSIVYFLRTCSRCSGKCAPFLSAGAVQPNSLPRIHSRALGTPAWPSSLSRVETRNDMRILLFSLVWELPGKWGSGKNTARMRPGLLEMVSGPGVRLFLPPVLLLKLRKKGTIKMTKKLRAGLSGRRSRKAGKLSVFQNRKTTGSKHEIFHAEDSFL